MSFLLAEISLLLAWGGLDFFLTSRLLPARDMVLRLALAVPLGVGTVTWVWFVLGWLGVPVDRLSFIAAYGVVLLAGAMLKVSREGKGALTDGSEPPGGSRQKTGSAARRAAILASATWAGTLMVLGAHSLVREVLFHLRRHRQLGTERLRRREFWFNFRSVRMGWVWRPSYPLNIPLAVATFQVLDGDLMAGAKLLFPFFGFSGHGHLWISAQGGTGPRIGTALDASHRLCSCWVLVRDDGLREHPLCGVPGAGRGTSPGEATASGPTVHLGSDAYALAGYVDKT